HVSKQQRVLDSTAHGSDMVQHFVHRDRECVLVAEHGHSQRIADQDHVNASFIHQPCGGIVVRGQASNGFVVELLFAKRCNSNSLARSANRSETHDVLQCPSQLGG